VIEGDIYHYQCILKDDFFSINILYRSDSGRRFVLKLSDFRFVFGLLFRPFAAWMSSHEYRIYSMIKDVEGVPALGPRLGRRGYFHEYIEGKTLHEWPRDKPLPADFFDRLGVILSQLHQRGIYYMDLNKQGNVIVGDDQQPWLIDFQICQSFRLTNSLWGRLGARVFYKMIREDIYHLYKHKRRFQAEALSEAEASLATRSRFGRRYNRFLGGPFRRLKRLIYPQGSNEIIWYKWKKLGDQSNRTS